MWQGENLKLFKKKLLNSIYNIRWDILANQIGAYH